MKLGQGAEDSPEWKVMIDKERKPNKTICNNCREPIALWHCAESGCLWCAKCSANLTNDKTKG